MEDARGSRRTCASRILAQRLEESASPRWWGQCASAFRRADRFVAGIWPTKGEACDDARAHEKVQAHSLLAEGRLPQPPWSRLDGPSGRLRGRSLARASSWRPALGGALRLWRSATAETASTGTRAALLKVRTSLAMRCVRTAALCECLNEQQLSSALGGQVKGAQWSSGPWHRGRYLLGHKPADNFKWSPSLVCSRACVTVPLHGDLSNSFSGAAWTVLASAERLPCGCAVLSTSASSELPKLMLHVPFVHVCGRMCGRMVLFVLVSRIVACTA